MDNLNIDNSSLDYSIQLIKNIKQKWADGEIKFDPKGHFGFEPGQFTASDPVWDRFYANSDYFPKHMVKNVFDVEFMFRIILFSHKASPTGDLEQAHAQCKSLASLQHGLEPFAIGDTSAGRCGECDVDKSAKSVKLYYADGVIYAESECDNPGGIAEYSVELSVPSGKIAFANDFRLLFPDPEEVVGHYIDVNCNNNIKLTTTTYADLGMVHMFVGNSCPGIYQNGNDLKIGSYYDEDTDSSDIKGYLQRGSICTDLWWFSAMDNDALLNNEASSAIINNKYADIDTIDVDPGIYRATYSPRSSDDDGRSDTYCVFERIGDIV